MEQEKQTLYFKDLLFAALYQWKAALIIGLVLALLLGAVGLFGFKGSVNLNTATITTEMQTKIDHLRSTVKFTQQNIDRQSQYLEESILYSIDPFQVYTAGFHIAVYPQSMLEATSDTYVVDTASAILRAYRSAFTGSEVIDAVAQSLDMQSQYLTELISVDSTVEGCIGFTFRGRDAQEAKRISNAFLAILPAQTDVISNKIEAHSTKILPFEMGPRVDTSLYETQAAAFQKLTTLKNTLVSAETELNRVLPTELSAISFSPALLAVIGAVLGVGLTACVAWVGHIGSDKIYSAKVLANRTGIRVLGCVAGDKKRDGITRWLRKLEGRSSCDHTDAVLSNIRNYCRDTKNLLILGQYSSAVLTPIAQKLEQSGIRCTLCADPQTDPKALEALPGCDAVLVAATCHASRYDNVQWIMQTAQDQDKKLAGCLLIDG